MSEATPKGDLSEGVRPRHVVNWLGEVAAEDYFLQCWWPGKAVQLLVEPFSELQLLQSAWPHDVAAAEVETAQGETLEACEWYACVSQRRSWQHPRRLANSKRSQDRRGIRRLKSPALGRGGDIGNLVFTSPQMAWCARPHGEVHSGKGSAGQADMERRELQLPRRLEPLIPPVAYLAQHNGDGLEKTTGPFDTQAFTGMEGR